MTARRIVICVVLVNALALYAFILFGDWALFVKQTGVTRSLMLGVYEALQRISSKERALARSPGFRSTK